MDCVGVKLGRLDLGEHRRVHARLHVFRDHLLEEGREQVPAEEVQRDPAERHLRLRAKLRGLSQTLKARNVKHKHAASIRAKQARALRSLTAYATPEPEAGRREPATWAPVLVMWSFKASSASDLQGAQPRHVAL